MFQSCDCDFHLWVSVISSPSGYHSSRWDLPNSVLRVMHAYSCHSNNWQVFIDHCLPVQPSCVARTPWWSFGQGCWDHEPDHGRQQRQLLLVWSHHRSGHGDRKLEREDVEPEMMLASYLRYDCHVWYLISREDYVAIGESLFSK